MNKKGKVIEDLLPRLKNFIEETKSTASVSSQESNDYAGDEESCDEISHDFESAADSKAKLEPTGRRNSDSFGQDFMATREYLNKEDLIGEKRRKPKSSFQRISRRYFSSSRKKGSSSPDLAGLVDEEKKSKTGMSRIGSNPDLISELPPKKSLRRKKEGNNLRIKRAGSSPNLALSSRKVVGKASRTSSTGLRATMIGTITDGNDSVHSSSSSPLVF